MVTQLVGLFGACLLAANALFQLTLAAGVRWQYKADGCWVRNVGLQRCNSALRPQHCRESSIDQQD